MAGYMGAENGMQLMNHPGLLLAGPGRGTKLGRGVPDPAAYAHKLFIGQIPYEAVEQDLWALFSAAGDVLELAILRSQGRSKGCAFLTYATREQVGVQIAVGRVQRAARRRCTAAQPQRAAGKGRALLFGGGEPRHGWPPCLPACAQATEGARSGRESRPPFLPQRRPCRPSAPSMAGSLATTRSWWSSLPTRRRHEERMTDAAAIDDATPQS